MAVKIVKNNKISGDLEIYDVGVTIPFGEQHTIPTNEYDMWSASSDLETAISNEDAIINDGNSDLSIQLALIFIKSNLAIEVGFDNRTNGFVSSNVQDAIEESVNSATNNDVNDMLFGNTGNITDTYLNTFNNLNSYYTPEPVSYNMKLRRIAFSSKTNASNFKVFIYKVDENNNFILIYTTDSLSGYTGHTSGELNISVEHNYRIAVRAKSYSNPKPQKISVKLVWQKV